MEGGSPVLACVMTLAQTAASLEIDAFSRNRIDTSVRELATEREQVQSLGLV